MECFINGSLTGLASALRMANPKHSTTGRTKQKNVLMRENTYWSDYLHEKEQRAYTALSLLYFNTKEKNK